MRRVVAVCAPLIALAVLFGFAAPAGAADDPIAQAAAGLRGHTVYVASDSGVQISQADVQSLEASIAKGRATIFIAVLPESAASEAGTVDGLPHLLSIAMGDPTAVFGVVSGHSFRAGAKAGAGLDAGEAAKFASQAVSAHSPAKEPLVNMLRDFVARVDSRVAQRVSADSPHATGTTRPAKESNVGKVLLIALGILVAGALALIAGIYIVRRRRRERDLVHRRNQLKRRINDCAKDVLDLEADVKLNDNAAAAYSNGVIAYKQAQAAWSETATDEQLDDVELLVHTAEAAFTDASEYAAGRTPHVDRAGEGLRRAAQPAGVKIPAERAPKVAPTETTTVVNNYNGGGHVWQGNYPGTGYGYYPGFGWGYYGYNGDFVTGMLVAEMLDDDRHDDDRHDDDRHDSSSDGDYGTSSDSGSGDWGSTDTPSDPGGSGDWGGDSTPSYDPPDSGGDFGGGFEGDSGGGFDSGGGGGDW